jgi:transposase-like protein
MWYNCSMNTIHFSHDDIDEIKRLYLEEKITLAAIANRFGVSHPTIRKYLLRSGVSTRRTWSKKTRTCRGKCGQTLPVSAFSKKDYVCKECRPSYNWEMGFGIKKYGITINHYKHLLQLQDSKCAICGRSAIDNGKNLAVDHDHATGAIRGLLCSKCNIAIGLLDDSPLVLQNAINYLLRTQKLP